MRGSYIRTKAWRKAHSERQKLRIGDKNSNWKGGIIKKPNGYIEIQRPNHPFCDVDGYVLEHRLIMEKHLKRFLSQIEVVHHKNHIRDDNRIENLELISSRSEHSRIHSLSKDFMRGQQWIRYKAKGWKKFKMVLSPFRRKYKQEKQNANN